MPTRHSVRLSPGEAEALLSVVGRPLERILVGGHPDHPPSPLSEASGDENGPFFNVELRFGDRTLRLGPQDVETRTAMHETADVDRVRVVVASDPPEELADSASRAGAVAPALFEIAAGLRRVDQVSVLTTLAWFTPPGPTGSVVVGDVELGGDGIGYGVELAHPRDAATLAMLAAADASGIDTGLVEFDIGLRFDLDAGRSLTVSTSGFALMLALDAPLPEDLRDVVELVPVRERLAGA